MDKIYSKKGKSQLDRMQSLLCMFPEERFDELPKWLQNDYHKLDKLIELVVKRRPFQELTVQEMKWVNGVFRVVKDLDRKYYRKKEIEQPPLLHPGHPIHQSPPHSPSRLPSMREKAVKQWIVFPKKGKSRNKLCNCGSGLKKKRCCWNIQRYKRI